MLEDIASRTHIDLKNTPFIGDTMKDIEAATAIDAIPILVRTGKGTSTLNSGEVPTNVKIYDDLYQAVDTLLKMQVR